jgi:hypothetical protein
MFDIIFICLIIIFIIYFNPFKIDNDIIQYYNNNKSIETIENKEVSEINNEIKEINKNDKIIDNTLNNDIISYSQFDKYNNNNNNNNKLNINTLKEPQLDIYLNNLLSIPERKNNRYTLKKANNITDSELQNISLKYADIDLFDKEDIIKTNNLNELTNLQNNYDSQIYLKSKRFQKQFKDSKTINSKLTKNLMRNNLKYNTELNKSTEPWWEEEIM